MTFAEDCAALSNNGPQCITCQFLASLDPQERSDVEAVLADRVGYSDSAVAKAISARGFPVTRSPVSNHRRSH